jgi:ABC-type multidrug transport system ATPase subunit
MGGIVLSARGLGFSYPGGDPLIEGLDLDLDRGGLLTVIGANGAGKSTLLDLLAGLRAPSVGTVEIFGEREGEKGAMSLLPQNVDYFLLGLTIEEEIGLSVKGREDVKERVDSLARQWGFSGRLGERVESLSGGEKKRLALLGALSGRPDVVFLDEPFSGLDWEGTQTLLADISSLKDRGETLVLVTHEPGLVAGITDSWLLLARGKKPVLAGSGKDLEGLLAPAGVRPF